MTKEINETNLFSKGTSRSPEVKISEDGVLKISGRSLMEDPSSFYSKKILDLENLAQGGRFKIADIQLEYLTSRSKLYILKILNILSEVECSKVIWRFEEEDEDIIELGKTFQAECDVPFNFVPITE